MNFNQICRLSLDDNEFLEIQQLDPGAHNSRNASLVLNINKWNSDSKILQLFWVVEYFA